MKVARVWGNGSHWQHQPPCKGRCVFVDTYPICLYIYTLIFFLHTCSIPQDLSQDLIGTWSRSLVFDPPGLLYHHKLLQDTMSSKLPIPNTNLAQVHQLQGLFRLTSCGHGLSFTLAPCAASAAGRASLELDFQSLQGLRSPGQSGCGAGRGGWVRGRARQAEPCSEESNLAPDILV